MDVLLLFNHVTISYNMIVTTQMTLYIYVE